MTSNSTTVAPRACWVVTEGMPGTENPCIALAEALGTTPAVKRIQVRAPWRWLSPELWPNPLAALSGEGDTLAAPFPDVVIGSGRKAAAPVAAVKRASPRTFTVFVQDPRMPLAPFDAVVVPIHDGLTGSNVVTTTGALSRVNAASLAAAREASRVTIEPLPAPRLAVLVGGKSHAVDLSTSRANRLGSDVADICARTGGSALVTTSRRTPEPAAEALRAALTATPSILWRPDRAPEPNPYFGFLGWADHVLVTADSVSMLSDAASTGAPVHIVPMDGTRAKLERLHRELVDLGIARHFDASLADWSPTPLAEAERVAGIVGAWMPHGAVAPGAAVSG